MVNRIRLLPRTETQRPAPSAGRIEVFSHPLDGPGPEMDFGELASRDEKLRASRFVFNRDRRRFENGRLWQRLILSAYCDVPPSAVEIRAKEGSKPIAVVRGRRVPFSWNATKTGAKGYVAVTGLGALGIDAEKIEDSSDLNIVAEDQFSRVEREALKSMMMAKRHKAFFRVWTGKEALVKATGEGLLARLSSVTLETALDKPAKVLSGIGAYAPELWTLHTEEWSDLVMLSLALDREITHIERFTVARK